MIRCETVQATRLQNILAAACNKGMLHDAFIPHSLKHDQKQPLLYFGAVKAQNVFLASSTAIRVDGFITGGLDLPYDDTDANITLRSMIGKSGLFSRIDETVTSFRSEGRALFVTDFARLAKAEDFIDNTLKTYFEDSLTWEQKETLLLPDAAYPLRVSNRKSHSDTIASYIAKLSSTIPPLATVEFDSSAKAPPSSKTTNAWTQKRNPVFFHEKPQTRSNKTRSTVTSDTSSVAESTNTAPTLATQLSTTEALIDSKIAALRAEMELSHASQIQDTYEKLVAPMIEKFDKLSTQMEAILTQRNHTPTTTAPPLHHHQADPRYAGNREPDTISVHSQSPGRDLPPQGYPYLGPPTTYQQPPPYHMHQSYAPPPNFDPLICSESNPHPEFAAQQQHQQQQPYYYQQPQDQHPHNYTPHQQHPAANDSISNPTTADLSMAELHHTMTDPNQSVINHTMTDPNTTLQLDELPASPQSPPAAPKGILKNTSDQTPSGGASK
jgi:hypothetical protein